MVLPSVTSGTSMLPPCAPGESDDTASICGETPIVPKKGAQGISQRSFQANPPDAVLLYSHTRSSKASCNEGVQTVEVRPPKKGTRHETAQSRVASMEMILTARVSPG